MRRCTPYGGVTPGDADPSLTVRLNWIPVSGISAPTSLKRLTGRARYRSALISTLDRSAVDRNEQNAKEKKRSRTERTRKNIRRWWRMSFPRYEWTINLARAREFAPIFCFKARYIVKKKKQEGGAKKNDRGRKTAPVTREWKERCAKLRRNRSTDHSRSLRVRNLRGTKEKKK